jgi:hypothetical protein
MPMLKLMLTTLKSVLLTAMSVFRQFRELGDHISVVHVVYVEIDNDAVDTIDADVGGWC